MRKLLIAGGVVLGLLVLAVVAVPFLVPTDTWKTQIESRVSAATGRDLRITGPVRLSLFPAVAVVANDVSFANVPGAREPAMATLAKLDVHVRVLPLLSGNVAIDRLVLDKPVIHLEVDRQGKPNWEFGNSAAPQPTASPTRDASTGGGGPADVALGDVRLSDGTITYVDDRSGAHYEASNIDATIKLANLDSPLSADGSLVWNKEKLSLTVRASAPRGLMTGKGSDLAVKLDSQPISASFTGRGEGTPLKLAGEVDLNTSSVRSLAAWAGQPLDMPGNGLGPLAIKGTLTTAPQHVSFAKASFKLDAIEASGDLSLDTGGRVPAIKAALTTNILDLNPYLPPEKTNAAPSPPARGGGAGGATASSGWSTEPLDLSGLKAANADLALTTEGLIVRQIKIGKAALHVALNDGKLVSDLTEMALYDGNGKAQVTLDGSGRVPSLAMTFGLQGVQAQPLLKDAMKLDRLRGAATADGTLTGSGASQRDLIGALNGKGSIQLRNGSIRGLDLGSMINNIGSAFSTSDNQQTEFTEATATYTVTNGVVHNDDLAMLAPLFRVVGKGTVDLPKRTVDYRLEPKLVADARGQGGSRDAKGIGVPIVISGTWDNISYKPDLLGVLPDAQQTIRGLRDVFRGGSQPPTQAPESPPNQQKSDPLDKLKGLLGR